MRERASDVTTAAAARAVGWTARVGAARPRSAARWLPAAGGLPPAGRVPATGGRIPPERPSAPAVRAAPVRPAERLRPADVRRLPAAEEELDAVDPRGRWRRRSGHRRGPHRRA